MSKPRLALLSVVALLFMTDSVRSQSIEYNQSTNTFSVVGLDPPAAPAGAKNKPYWKYFWEFGDGHYDVQDQPSYCYSVPPSKPVRVSMTPYYSYAPSLTLSQDVEANICSQARTYPAYPGLVHIASNANGELVPANAMEVVLHYRTPANHTGTGGYLMLFYNSNVQGREMRLRFDPLTYSTGDERLYNAEPMAAVIPDQMTTLSEEARTSLRSLMNEYEVKGFRCNVEPGKEQRLFTTLVAHSALDTTVIKGKKGELNINIKALWIPDDTVFDPERMISTYALQLLSVHDPNKLRILRPAGTAYFNKRLPQWLEYQIHFQNKGGRPVRHLDIEVPWDANLDYRSIDMIKRDPDAESCAECPEGIDPRSSVASCFAIDTALARTEGKVIFSFYNVMIHGKNEGGVGGGKYTRGFIQYRVKSNGERIDKQSSRALIIFEAGEPLLTRPDRKKWKHKYYGVKMGRNFKAALDGFEYIHDDVARWYNVAFVYKNTSIFNGTGYGLELGSAGFGFRNWSIDFVPEFESFEVNDEIIDLKTLDLQAMTEIRLGGAISAGVGAGISVPLIAEGLIYEGRPFSEELQQVDWDLAQQPETATIADLERMKTYSGNIVETVSAFGLLDKKETAFFDNFEIRSRTGIGAIATAQLEAGFLNGFAVGARYAYRIYPKSYKEQCVKIGNAELYVRFKIATAR